MAVDVLGTRADLIERLLPDALGGDERAARAYARAWNDLVDSLLAEHPDAPSGARDVLHHVALTAPFHPAGPVDALMSAASDIIPDMAPPPPHASAPSKVPQALDYRRFSRFVLLESAGAGTGLERLLAGWELTVTELASLFGVRRQAVQQWLTDGVPPARQPKLAVIHRIADLLERNLRPERIPAVVRAPAVALGEASMLELIADDRQDQLLDAVARSFDWAATA
jgi:transcriptional regulator with XRE-family HTH domain